MSKSQIAPDGAWIEWRGGECPVEDGTRIRVKLRGDAGRICHSWHPQNLRWTHRKSSEEIGSGDIIAYHVVDGRA